VQPDIILVDISIPDGGGIPLVQCLRKEGNTVPTVMLTMHEDPVWCRRAMEAGANGYLLKGDAFAELVTGIETVLNGNTYISSRIPTTADSPLSQLSIRELEVLQLICQGKSNRIIADELCLSIKTIETHRTKLMKKLNLHNTADLVRRSIELGIF
jgi:DNA-binding NarL/FixJ family response regulator